MNGMRRLTKSAYHLVNEPIVLVLETPDVHLAKSNQITRNIDLILAVHMSRSLPSASPLAYMVSNLPQSPLSSLATRTQLYCIKGPTLVWSA